MFEKLKYATVILVPIFGFFCARGAKGLGQKIAVTRLTNTDSVTDTINSQVRAFGGVGSLAILLVATSLALMIFAPAAGIWWAPLISTLIGFGANLTLGFSAGVGNNVAGILAKPGARDTIDCQLEMKRRTRRHLKTFLKKKPPVLLLLCAVAGLAHADDGVWAWAIDITDSMDPDQRELAIANLIDAAPERARTLAATWIQVVKFDEAGMLSDVVWVPVPAGPSAVDCRQSKPLPMVTEGLVGLSPALAEGRKRKAVEDCLAHQRGERESQADQERGFRERLQAATRITSKANVKTRIVPVLQWLVGGPRTVAVDTLTDGIDNSAIPPESLKIPEHVRVTMIITRPNPKRTRPRLDDVLSAAKTWARVAGISVVGVGEYAGLWVCSRKEEAR